MAQGFFSRVGNLWKGFLSLWVSDVERKNPEIAYENAINSMVEKYAKLILDRSPQGFTAMILMMTFLSGVNLLFLGVIGEYVGRIFEEVKRRPLYIVDAVIRPAAKG